ncbi:epoxide hydrolase 4-like [Cucurbita pepo subsp. pepo]|uniref:epoxide hydrolase 4-like n=1 Tax=Cucurbita pepo subsp. pepo TaxID=3664 RepID=UPI000C9D6EFB|nr:epoxide hydrolase 4-like [Cucurbita pepo subsp. pepo]
MWPSFLSLVSLYDGYLRRCFTAAGLTQQAIDIDAETTLSFWGPKLSKSNAKPSLLLLHGFGPMAIWQWRPQVQFLADDFDVYVPDLVFFGGSTTKSAERTEVFQAISIGKLLEKIGVKKYSVMGTSYGGFVAYHMARIWPERIEKVVIASSGVNMRRKDNDAMLKRANVENIDEFLLPMTAEQLRTLMKLAVFKGVGRRMPDFFLNDFIHKLYMEKRKEKIELLKSLTLGREDTIDLSPLFQEVLIIWGDHDQLFPLEMAKELKEILGEKTRLEVMKETSHVPQIEAPAEFNRVAKSFLCGL